MAAAVDTRAGRFDHAFADAAPRPFWTDGRRNIPGFDPLAGREDADLVVVGAGLTGLWAAVRAMERNPQAKVVLIEGREVAFGASGRNGGFCESSLTHGLENGIEKWPDEIVEVEKLAAANFAGIVDTVKRHGIDCDFREVATLSVATEPHQVEWLRDAVEPYSRFNYDVRFLDTGQVRALVDSPTYLAGLATKGGSAIVDPARLCWGLARVADQLGVKVFENSPVVKVEQAGAGLRIITDGGEVHAPKALFATSAFPPVIGGVRPYVVPVYDYVLMTEPLTDEQLASVGWQERNGISDSSNQFHYYRLTEDNRILWGGYDAIYHFRNRVDPKLEQRHATFSMLADHFFATFPQLEGVRFTHRWAGAIDTCSRFSVMFSKSFDGRAVYVGGFTGLGVGASRFGADTGLDLLDGVDSRATRLSMVRRRPIPFPPEPLRWIGIQFTRRALAKADRNQGRRGPWLRLLDTFGMGYDS